MRVSLFGLRISLAFACCAAISASAETVLLQNAEIHTVSGQPITGGAVLLNGAKIEKVLTAADAGNATADQKIDLKGLHLYPGLICLDTSLGLNEIGAVRASRDERESGDYTTDVQSWVAVNPDSELLPVARGNGVAFVEPAPQGSTVAGQSGLIVLDGWTTEQMAFKKIAALHVYWPSMSLDTTPKEKFKDQSKWKSFEDQAKERQRKIKALEDFFEEGRAYAKLKAAKSAEFQQIPAWEAVLPYVRSELPIVVHADEIREIKAAINWATTNHFKVILAGARDAFMAADQLATNNIPVIYENVFTQPVRDTEPYDVHFKAPALLHKAGVKVAFSLGGDTFDSALIKNLPYHAAQGIGYGLPREEALKGITLYPAEMMGVADRIGSIEAGKDATLFAADGDILDIRSNVKRMWIAGKEVNLESRHTRLYQKYKNRPVAK